MMKDFILAALPWVCMGLALAILAAHWGSRAKQKSGKDDKSSPEDNYMVEGMCLGMAVGLSLGGAGYSYGMLLGMVIGMCIPKKHQKDKVESQ